MILTEGEVRRTIITTFHWPYVHYWPEGAKYGHALLQNPHRHLMHVRVELQVFESDREIEFIELGRQMLTMLRLADEGAAKEAAGALTDEESSFTEMWTLEAAPLADVIFDQTASCEMIAEYLGRVLQIEYGDDREIKVEVMEDGENGGTWSWSCT